MIIYFVISHSLFLEVQSKFPTIEFFDLSVRTSKYYLIHILYLNDLYSSLFIPSVILSSFFSSPSHIISFFSFIFLLFHWFLFLFADFSSFSLICLLFHWFSFFFNVDESESTCETNGKLYFSAGNFNYFHINTERYHSIQQKAI